MNGRRVSEKVGQPHHRQVAVHGAPHEGARTRAIAQPHVAARMGGIVRLRFAVIGGAVGRGDAPGNRVVGGEVAAQRENHAEGIAGIETVVDEGEVQRGDVGADHAAALAVRTVRTGGRKVRGTLGADASGRLRRGGSAQHRPPEGRGEEQCDELGHGDLPPVEPMPRHAEEMS